MHAASASQSSELSGKVAIVTGAGRGVGFGIAMALARAGANIAVTGRSRSNLTDALAAVRPHAPDSVALECTVGDRSSIEAMVATTAEHFGRIDVFVHNAAGDLPDQRWPLEDVSDEQWDSLAATSIRGTYDCAQAVYPHLRASGGNLIVLTSSAGVTGTAILPVYAAVKGAQRGFVSSLAREWGPDGIRVNAIGPLALTRGLQRSFGANPDGEATLTARIPLRRIGDPERDIGAVAVFLASTAAAYVTGQTLFADGGVFTG